MTTPDYSALREAATRATPGPWDVWREPTPLMEDAIAEFTDQVHKTDDFAGAVYLLNANGKCPATTGCGPTSEANAAYIALANPSTILALLDERERLSVDASNHAADAETVRRERNAQHGAWLDAEQARRYWMDRAEAAEAEAAALKKALEKLEREASEVSRLGAQPGRQWTLLAGALINARSALTTKGNGQ